MKIPRSKPLLISIATVCSCLLLSVAWYAYCVLVPLGNGAVVRNVSFPPGSGIRKLAVELKKGGIIRSSWQFMIASRLQGHANRLKAGDYRFNDSMDERDIFRKLVNGDVDFIRFTLPEGYSIYQAAELLEQKGLFKSADFLQACRSPRLLSRLGIKATSLEGYLYPATYNLINGGTAENLVEQMLNQFEKAYTALGPQASGVALSRHELLTLASMIEKEAVSPAERPLIASVFHNRLRLGMRLQSDPTAVYGLRAFGGKVTKADIMRKNPYNTYLIKGLPPGPIGNPGIDAIKAAMNPTPSGYIYFVARQDGTHQFSRTLAEHNQAVRHYLK
jgi:UPF0755 protein